MHVIKLKNSFYDANAYLVDGKMLIDVGIDSTSIIAQLENHLSSDLETIILTHCHFDHSGGAKEVASEFGAKIAIHMDDARLLNNPHASVAEFFGSQAPVIDPDILLKGGEVIGGLQVIHTPGHTPGGISLYNPESRLLFTGDTVFQEGGFGRTDFYGGSALKLIESLRKLSMLDVSIMYPGHGDIVTEDANGQIRLSLMMAEQYSGT